MYFTSNQNDGISENYNQNRNIYDGIGDGDITTLSNNNNLEEAIESNITNENVDSIR